MAKGDLIRVPGYSQRVFYNGNIEYRNFSDNLVGNQSIINIDDNNRESSSLFTMGNFVVTTNSTGRTEYAFRGKSFTNYYNLTSLNFTNDVKKIISNNVDIKLNLDNNKLSSYAYFGSATEFVRVTLENIITYWPASLYLNPLLSTTSGDFTGYTVENYTYDAYNDKSTLDVNVLMIMNNFDIVFTTNGNIGDTFNQENPLRNFTLNYTNYVIYYNDVEYPILSATTPTNEIIGYLNLVVEGNPFEDNTTTARTRTSKFHIKPNKLKVDEFFNNLTSFEKNILNRDTTPKYKSIYDYNRLGDDGIVYRAKREITWPVNDGYNIDFSSYDYVEYVNELIEISNNSDKASSDILTRFLVAESISNFDSLPNFDGTFEVSSGQKMTKILKIYGRSFDEVKLWMDGLKLFNTVTYDKKNNVPDQLVKDLAKNLGWEMTTPISDNNLLSHYIDTKQSTYSGKSTGLSSQQAETEMWRRLIINSAWLFKSKGSRKSIEFFFKFLGIPKGLVDLNEYIYRAKNKIDMDLFYKILKRFDLFNDLTLYNVDADGYPKFPAQTSTMYFQNSGLWYRQTAGAMASDHILTGNNPHIGPYDGGQAYLMQLHNLIPNFTPFTITNEVKITGSTNLFYNYNGGKINSYSGKTFINVLDSRGVDKSKCSLSTVNIIQDPFPNYNETICGCPSDNKDDILSVCLKNNYTISSCDSGFTSINYVSSPTNIDGTIAETPYVFLYTKKIIDINNVDTKQTYKTVFRDKSCCTKDGGIPYLYDKYTIKLENNIYNSVYFNTGYVCAKSKGIEQDSKTSGGGCFITCQWRLPFTDSNGTAFRNFANNPITLTDIIWTDANGNKYLKFVSPKNNWGMVKTDGAYLVGAPEFKYTNKSDSCFCDLNISDPVQVIDPVTREIGYGCKIKLTNFTNANTRLLYDYSMKHYYAKSIKSISCATTRSASIK